MGKSRMNYITDLLAEYDNNDSIRREAEIKNEIREFCSSLLREIKNFEFTLEIHPDDKSIIANYCSLGRDHYTCWRNIKKKPDGECVSGFSILHGYYFRGEYGSDEYFISDYIVDDVSKLAEYYGPACRRPNASERITEHLTAAAELLRETPKCDVLPEEIKEYLLTNF